MMAVSKRTRFEVLRRDNHACRYCGSAAPDVKITVDHVLPVTLGGSDDPSNLVACCAACNSGKSSTSPTESVVSDVNQDAIRWAAARKLASDQRAKEIRDSKRKLAPFLKVWKSAASDMHLPPDWRYSVTTWLADGLTMDELIECAAIALANEHVRDENLFRYMAGIVRNKIAELDKATHSILAKECGEPDPATDSALRDAWSRGYAKGKRDAGDPIRNALTDWIDSPEAMSGIYDHPGKGCPGLDVEAGPWATSR